MRYVSFNFWMSDNLPHTPPNSERLYTFTLADNTEMARRWSDIAGALQRSFTGSQFNGNYTADSPLIYTRAGVQGQLAEKVGHALALDGRDRTVGGIFCIPIENPHGNDTCDIGWVFTVPETPLREKVVIMDGLVTLLGHTVLSAGYQGIITSMGTPAGERVLRSRYGFRHEPTEDNTNRWTWDPQSWLLK